MTLRTLTGGARWDEATRYEPPPPGNGIGGQPCPCGRPHGFLYSDPACDAAYARAELVRTTAIATSAERGWLEQPPTERRLTEAEARAVAESFNLEDERTRRLLIQQGLPVVRSDRGTYGIEAGSSGVVTWEGPEHGTLLRLAYWLPASTWDDGQAGERWERAR